MVCRPFRLRFATLLVVSGILGAPAYANSGAVERKPPRPAPDFPTLEDYYPLQAKRAGQEGSVVIHIQAGSPQVPAEDPQLNAIRERSRIVMERLQRAIEAVGKAAPEPAH